MSDYNTYKDDIPAEKTLSDRTRDALAVLADIAQGVQDGDDYAWEQTEALADALESQDAALLLQDLAAFALNRALAPGIAMMTKRDAWRTAVNTSTLADDELNGEWQPKQ